MAGRGAPKGGRVHWFEINLSQFVKKHYDLKGNYLYHNYTMIRKFRAIDSKERNKQIIFQVVRTSLRCWHMIYSFCETGDMDYITFKTSFEAAEYVNILAEQVEQVSVINGDELYSFMKAFKNKWQKDHGVRQRYSFHNDF